MGIESCAAIGKPLFLLVRAGSLLITAGRFVCFSVLTLPPKVIAVKPHNRGICIALGPRVYIEAMKALPKLELTPEQKKIAAELGRQGGLARAKSLSAGERLKIAKHASKAAAAARKKKARERKKEQ